MSLAFRYPLVMSSNQTFLPQVEFDILVLCLSSLSTIFRPLKAICSDFEELGGFGRTIGGFASFGIFTFKRSRKNENGNCISLH
jgi:hypothetical protein